MKEDISAATQAHTSTGSFLINCLIMIILPNSYKEVLNVINWVKK